LGLRDRRATIEKNRVAQPNWLLRINCVGVYCLSIIVPDEVVSLVCLSIVQHLEVDLSSP
jgi:hypothetical protein